MLEISVLNIFEVFLSYTFKSCITATCSLFVLCFIALHFLSSMDLDLQ